MSSSNEDDNSAQSVNYETDISGSRKMQLRERPRRTKQGINTRLQKMFEDFGNLSNFDSDRSTREKKKLTRKHSQTSISKTTTLYDERIRSREYSNIYCDCLENCPGCFLPCPTCSSRKCGPQCRINRKYVYETVTFDGKDTIITNKNFLGS